MKQTVIQIKFDTNKYQALKRYAIKKEVSLEQELEDTLIRLYKKLVPVDVREFIEEYEEPVKPKAKKESKEGDVVSKKENEVVNVTTNIQTKQEKTI
mgnify:FL=1